MKENVEIDIMRSKTRKNLEQSEEYRSLLSLKSKKILNDEEFEQKVEKLVDMKLKI